MSLGGGSPIGDRGHRAGADRRGPAARRPSPNHGTALRLRVRAARRLRDRPCPWEGGARSETVAIAQALIGVVLLLVGRRPTTALHYVYGFGPLVVFAIAHVLGREEPDRRPWPSRRR